MVLYYNFQLILGHPCQPIFPLHMQKQKNKAGRLNERAQMVYHERRGIIEQQGKERQGRHCFAKHCNKTKPNHHRHKNILLILFIFTFILPLFASFLPSLHIFFLVDQFSFGSVANEFLVEFIITIKVVVALIKLSSFFYSAYIQKFSSLKIFSFYFCAI